MKKLLSILLMFLFTISSISASSNSEKGWPRTLVDASGRKVVLEKKPERIIITHSAYVRWFLTFGVIPVGCAGIDDFSEDTNLKINDYINKNPDIKNMVEIGGTNNPNWEKISELKPDFILLGSWQENLYESASKIAPTFVDTVSAGSDWQERTNIFGEILGEEEKAKEIIKDTLAYLKNTRDKLSKHSDKTFVFIRPDDISAIYLMGTDTIEHSKDGLNLTAPNTKNFPKTFDKVTVEGLAEMDPDYIMLLSYHEQNENFKKYLQESSLGKSLKAVKNNNVFLLPVTITGNHIDIIKYLCDEMLTIVGE